MKRIIGLFLAALPLHAQVDPDAPDRARFEALAKVVLRDSAELPLDIDSITLVTSAAGKVIHRDHAPAHLLFHGYSAQSGRFSFSERSGLMNPGVLRESMGGTFAVIAALTHLAPAKQRPNDLDIKPQGNGFLLRSRDRDCHQFEMQSGRLFPTKFCSTAEFTTTPDAAGAMTLQHFTLDVDQLPAPGKLPWLGDVQVLRFRTDAHVQRAWLPSDTRPFIIPDLVVTRIETDKGTIALTNTYKLAPPKPKK